jgi:hypothetical protein
MKETSYDHSLSVQTCTDANLDVACTKHTWYAHELN